MLKMFVCLVVLAFTFKKYDSRANSATERRNNKGRDRPRFNFADRLYNFSSKIMQAVTELATATMLLGVDKTDSK